MLKLHISLYSTTGKIENQYPKVISALRGVCECRLLCQCVTRKGDFKNIAVVATFNCYSV